MTSFECKFRIWLTIQKILLFSLKKIVEQKKKRPPPQNLQIPYPGGGLNPRWCYVPNSDAYAMSLLCTPRQLWRSIVNCVISVMCTLDNIAILYTSSTSALSHDIIYFLKTQWYINIEDMYWLLILKRIW